ATSPVTGVLHLILTLFTASVMWMLIQAEFLALVLVIVYVGAVMVLFLLVVMMLDMRTEGLKQGLKVYLPLGLTIGGSTVLSVAVDLRRSWVDAPAPPVSADDFDDAQALGAALHRRCACGGEAGGVVLLVGRICAIALMLRKRGGYKGTDPCKQVNI